MILVGFSVFLLATGGATLNSLQEYRLDGSMQRTRERPLVKGVLSKKQAAVQTGILMLTGGGLLAHQTDSWLPLFVGVTALLLYNGVYTPLKKITIWSIVPGAFCGAMPPYIGWLSGGGATFSYGAMLIIGLFLLWQVPHYWLVLLSFQSDYRTSELPNLLRIFDEKRLQRFFITWVGALVITMLMFVTLQPMWWLSSVGIIINGCFLLSVFMYAFFLNFSCDYSHLFMVLNCSLLSHMLIVAIGVSWYI